MYILNILRIPGKNEFVVLNEHTNRYHFLAVDLDRANISNSIKFDSPTFCDSCVFGNQTTYNIEKALSHYSEFTSMFHTTTKILGEFNIKDEAFRTLKLRLGTVSRCINLCMEKYLPSTVIVPDETWVV